MEAWGFVHRGDAHQALERQAEGAAFGDERVGVVDGASGLLILVAGVHLNEDVRAAPDFFGDAGDGAGQFGAVDGVNGVEKLHRGAGLVGLQRADQVKLDIVEFLTEGGPFALRFLHAVFAEDAVAFIEDGFDAVERLNLADGDECDVFRVALVAFDGEGDALLDIGEAHGLVLSRHPQKKRAGTRPALPVSNP